MNYARMIERIENRLQYRKNLLICGEPGGGKSALMIDGAERAGRPYIVLHPAIDSPIDYKGIPCVVDGRAEFLPYGHLRKIIADSGDLVVIIDDMGQGTPATQAALMQVVHARQIGEHTVPSGVSFIAATNRRADLSAVTGVLNALGSRFMRLDLDRDPEGWIDWYVRQEALPPTVAAFIRLRPDLLYSTANARDDVNVAVANPRTWHFTAELLNEFPAADAEDIGGYVGKAAAAEFEGFRELERTLPDPRLILSSPDTAPVPPPENGAAMYAISTAAAHIVHDDESRARAVLTYARRLPAAFTALTVADIIRRYPAAAEYECIAAWRVDNQELDQ